MIDKLKIIGKDILTFFIYYLLSAFCLSLIVNSNIKDHFLIELIALIIPTLYLIIKFKKEYLSSLKDFKKNYKKYLKKHLHIGLIGIILMNIFSLIITKFIGSTSSNELIMRSYLKDSNILYALIVSGILVPFGEETIFRLNFRNITENKLLFIFITGLFFALSHMLSTTSLIEFLFIIPYLTMGLILGYIFRDNNNIFNSILIHCLNNIATIIVYLIIGVIWKNLLLFCYY